MAAGLHRKPSAGEIRWKKRRQMSGERGAPPLVVYCKAMACPCMQGKDTGLGKVPQTGDVVAVKVGNDDGADILRPDALPSQLPIQTFRGG